MGPYALCGPGDNDPRLRRPDVIQEERLGAPSEESLRESEFVEDVAVPAIAVHSGGICLFPTPILGAAGFPLQRRRFR